jgi:dihydroorotate dehydrogenase (NAD+) catalytic subunit
VKPTLSVEVAGIHLPTPVMIASGCFSSARELTGLLDLRKVGGIVTRSVTLTPELGAPAPRMAETSSGLLTANGLQNDGVEAFVETLPSLLRIGVPLFASIGGRSVEDYQRVAARLVALRAVSGLELNLSCPDLAREGRAFANDAAHSAEVVAAVAGVSRVPVFAKLSLDGIDVVEVARQCVASGARGLTLVNAIAGLAIDPETLQAKLATGSGVLSGPAIKPLALLAVSRVAEALPDVPILGVGGIASADDAIEFLAAGASAVQVGTAMLRTPSAPVDVAVGVGRYLVEHALASPAAVRASARQPQSGMRT